MRYSIYELVHKVILPWMPGYQAIQDSQLGAVWHLRKSDKGRAVGGMTYDYDYGLRIRLEDPELTKELKALILINNLEDTVSVYCNQPRALHD